MKPQYDPTTRPIYKKVYGKNRDEGFRKFQALVKEEHGVEINTLDLIGVTQYGTINVKYIESYRLYYIIFAVVALVGFAGGDYVFVPGLMLIFLLDILLVRRMAIGYMGYIFYTDNYYFAQNGLKKYSYGSFDEITEVRQGRRGTILKKPTGDSVIQKVKLTDLGLFGAFLRERRPDLF